MAGIDRLWRWCRVMHRASFQIVYDGPDIIGGSMDVRELAPALLAIGDLIDSANAELNGDSSRVAVRVNSDFKTGSFEVTLELFQTLLEQAKDLFGSKQPSTTDALISAAIGGFAILRWLRNRKIESVTEIDNGKVRITTSQDYDVLVADGSSVKILRNTGVRKAIAAFAKSVAKDGINFVELRYNQRREKVLHHEAGYLELPNSVEPLNEDIRTVTLTVLVAAFEEDRPWRLSDGASEFNAVILDDAFKQRVNDHCPFAKGDELLAKVRYIQKRVDGRLRMEREVVEVLEHRHVPDGQGKLF